MFPAYIYFLCWARPNFNYTATLKDWIQSFIQSERTYYFADPLRYTNIQCKTITIKELAKLIKNKKMVIYTGAGLSVSAGIATMSELEKMLLIDQGMSKFFQTIFFEPQILTDGFSDFCRSAISGKPTAAHQALHEITQSKQICLLTENVDLLQQRTGSLPLLMHGPELDNLKAEDCQAIEILLCIGLSHDDCGFINYYKQNNSQGKIVAINLTQPPYLSVDDFFLQGDLQKILPKLSSLL